MGLLALVGPTQGAVAPPVSPITISLVTATPINVSANSPAGTDIAQLQLNAGASGTGVWTMTGFNKARLAEAPPGGSIVAPINGTSVFVEVSQQLSNADAVAATNVTVQYDGEGLLTPVTFTVQFNVVAVTQQSFATAPETAFALNYTTLTGAGTVTPGADGVVITGGAGTGDSQHMQVLSKLAVAKDFVMVVDITVLDSSVGTGANESLLIHFQTEGDLSAGHPKDINLWPLTTGATRFEEFSLGYRLTLDPLHPGGQTFDQVRLRACDAPGAGLSSGLPKIIDDTTADGNTVPGSFPFVTGIKYRCTISKLGQDFSFKYQDLTTVPAPAAKTFPLKTDPLLDDYTSGRFIFKVMAGRSAKFNVQSVTEQEFVDPGDGGGGAEFPFDIAAIADNKKHTVTTEQQFKDAINDNTIGAGHVVTVNQQAGQVWAGPFTFDKVIPQGGLPVIYKADINQGVTISGNITFATTSSNQMLWGFKMVGPGQMFLQGNKNRAQRFDHSGWGRIAVVMTNGADCMWYYCTVHDPTPYSAADIAAAIANTKDNNDRYGFRMGSKPNDFPMRYKILGIHGYNFPNRPNPARYSSGQTDMMEHGYDVDFTATGANPEFRSGCMFERMLCDLTHSQYTLSPTNVSATLDIKAQGSKWKNVTILCLGKFDIRGGGLNDLDDFYIEGGKGMWVNGGGTKIRNWKLVAGTQDFPVIKPDGSAGGTINPSTPEINLIMGNGRPNQNTTAAGVGDDPYFQACEDTLCEDIRGKVTVGRQFSNAKFPPRFQVRNTVLRRVQTPNIVNTVVTIKNNLNVTVFTGVMHVNTTNEGGTPSSVAPTKLTAGRIVGGNAVGDCGHLAPWVAPTLFTA